MAGPGKVVAVVAAVAAVAAMVACRTPGPPAPAAAPAVVHVARGPLASASLMADVGWLTAPARAGRGSFQPGGRAAADYMARELAAAGLTVSRQHLIGGADNVIGVLAGDDQAVLVGAHYDHLGITADGTMYPGADDNASGSAVLLALARSAADRPHRHTILFVAFGAEEAGLIGSGAYVREPAWPLERTVAVVNFDMVGRRFFGWGGGRDATAAVVGLEADARLASASRASAAAAGLHLVVVPARLVELFGFDDRTDEWWFRRQRIPSIHFSTSLHDDYHQPTDTADKLDPGQLERVARTAAGLLDYLAGDWDGVRPTPRSKGRTGR